MLLDRELRIVHAGYSASDELDEKIRRLAGDAGAAFERVETDLKRQWEPGRVPGLETSQTSAAATALFFIATWCDWYLEDTRPAMSRNCVNAQHAVNAFYRDWPALNWIGVASRMWTGIDELEAYRERFDVEHPLEIDRLNETILRHGIRNSKPSAAQSPPSVGRNADTAVMPMSQALGLTY